MRECNPQHAIINSLDVPIIVQAGAGSGKTYTLTERIVNFLKEGGDIESVVAITFTKKAAEELKSRIRGRLEEEGMHVQALKVDDAYISTIHGFASKILKENALSFSMDPNFEVIDEAKNNYIANNAIKQAIYYVASGKQFAKEIDSQTNIIANAEVFDEDVGDEGFDSSGFKSIDLNPTGSLIGAIAGQIQEALGDILKEASSKILSQSAVSMLTKDEIGTVDALEKSVAEILEKIELIPFFDEERIFLGKRIEYDEIFTKLNQLVKGFLNRIEFKTTKQDQKIEIAFVDLIREMEDLNFRLITKDKSLNLKKELAYLFEITPILSPKFHEKEGDFESVLSFKCDFAKLAVEFMCSAGYDSLIFYRELALAARDLSCTIKSNISASNNDLLRLCFENLCDLPEVSKRYANKFSIIMIDEFQDTDRLQLGIVGQISKRGMSNVCTVGDVQQSIYRFRGADVNTYLAYKEMMLATNRELLFIDLPNNYRSHADVLSFCDLVFKQNEMFGKDFLHLEPKGKVNEVKAGDFVPKPRVKIDITNYSSRSKNKITSEEVVYYQAKTCADHFKTLVDAGENPGKMAILLGKLVSGKGNKNATPLEIAKIYSNALRDVGIDSIICAGSTFSMSFEVEIVKNLLAYGRNCFDSTSLLNILRSKLFSFSNDSLLALTHAYRKGVGEQGAKTIKHAQLSRMFISPDDELLAKLAASDKENYEFALCALTQYLTDVKNLPVSIAIRNFLNTCGIFDKLDDTKPEGLVSGGNFVKCFHILDEIEKECAGLAYIHKQFLSQMEFSNESPGVLSETDSKYVQIMTVHASKGLQFDHVVCAELRDGLPTTADKSQRLYVSNMQSQSATYYTNAAYLAKIGDLSFSKLTKANPYFFDQTTEIYDNMSAGELFTSLYLTEKKEAYNEAKRLLYVAVTRAVKSVMLMHRINAQVGDRDENWTDVDKLGIFGNLYRVLKWDYSAPRSLQIVKLPNGSDAQVFFTRLPEAMETEQYLETSQDQVEVSAPDKETFIVRQNNNDIKIACECGLSKRNDFCSFSTLSQFADEPDDLDFSGQSVSYLIDEEDKGATSFAVSDPDRATDFGDKLHFYMQMLVAGKSGEVFSEEDAERLSKSVKRIVNTDAFNEALSKANSIPEADFCVELPALKSGVKFLRGALDLVSFDDMSLAYVIDYKSGTNPKSHELQAKTYAYGLMKSGFEAVSIDFLHAEIADSGDNEACAIQSFEFDKSNLFELENEIITLANSQFSK